MKGQIDVYLNRKVTISFILVELGSLLLTFLLDGSLITILVLTTLNIVTLIYSLGYLKIHVKNSIKTKQIYNEYGLKPIALALVSGILIIIFSYFLFPRFYALGFAFLLYAGIPLLMKKRIKGLQTFYKQLTYEKATEALLNRSFFTVIFLFAIPMLLDLHYNLLGILNFLYSIILAIYFLTIILFMIISLDFTRSKF